MDLTFVWMLYYQPLLSLLGSTYGVHVIRIQGAVIASNQASSTKFGATCLVPRMQRGSVRTITCSDTPGFLHAFNRVYHARLRRRRGTVKI